MSDIETLSDFDLAVLFHDTMERHDNLIDSAVMGDERIYFANRKCEACKEEQRRRGYEVCRRCHDFGGLYDLTDEFCGFCNCAMGEHFKAKAEKRAALRAAFAQGAA